MMEVFALRHQGDLICVILAGFDIHVYFACYTNSKSSQYKYVQSVNKYVYECLRKSVIFPLKINIFPKFNHQWNSLHVQLALLGFAELSRDSPRRPGEVKPGSHQRLVPDHNKPMYLSLSLDPMGGVVQTWTHQ